MPAPFQFDKAVLQVVADDKQMLSTLKRDEGVINQSVQKMQGNLNKLEVSMKGTGSAAGVATTGVSALGAAASATGSTTLMAGAGIANMGVALNLLGNEALGAKQQMAAMTRASLAFIATPIGAAIVALAAVLAVLTLGWRKDRAEAAKAREELEKLNATIKAGAETTRKFAEGTERVADKLAVARGEMMKAEAAARALHASLGEQIRGGLAVEEAARRLRLETQLVETLERQAHAKRKQRMEDERAARITKIQLAAEQERAALAEKAAAAAAALRAQAGPQTRGEVRAAIDKQIQLADAQQRAIFMLTKELEASRPGGQRGDIILEMLRGLGVRWATEEAAKRPGMRFGAGAMGIAQFAATGRGMMPGVQRDPAEQQRIDREAKRTRAADRTAVATEAMATRLQTLNLGSP